MTGTTEGTVGGERQALGVSVASLGWTVAASVATLAIGINSDSIAFIAFGAIGMLDGAGSAALVIHFLHVVRHGVTVDRRERLALNVVTIGLLLVAAATAAVSTHRLLVSERSKAAPAGLVVAGLSVVILAALTRAKRRVAARTRSHALHADSWVSAVGAALSAITLAGSGLTAVVPWAWPDPAAALAIAAVAVIVSINLRHDATT